MLEVVTALFQPVVVCLSGVCGTGRVGVFLSFDAFIEPLIVIQWAEWALIVLGGDGPCHQLSSEASAKPSAHFVTRPPAASAMQLFRPLMVRWGGGSITYPFVFVDVVVC